MRFLEAINKMGDKAIKRKDGHPYFFEGNKLGFYGHIISPDEFTISWLDEDQNGTDWEIVDRPEKPKKQVDTAKAIEALKSGKTVQSVITEARYKLVNGSIKWVTSDGLVRGYNIESRWTTEEILGDWLI